MNTQKVAITMPTDLLAMIDDIRKKKGISRSKFIYGILSEKIQGVRKCCLKDAYRSVFSDESICKEQLHTAKWFERGEINERQEW